MLFSILGPGTAYVWLEELFFLYITSCFCAVNHVCPIARLFTGMKDFCSYNRERCVWGPKSGAPFWYTFGECRVEQGEAGAGSTALCTRGKEGSLFEAGISTKKQGSPPLVPSPTDFHPTSLASAIHPVLIWSPCTFTLIVMGEMLCCQTQTLLWDGSSLPLDDYLIFSILHPSSSWLILIRLRKMMTRKMIPLRKRQQECSL